MSPHPFYDTPTNSYIRWRLVGAFLSLCTINFACAVDQTVLGVALPVLAADLKGSAAQTIWAGNSFLLAATVSQPPFSSMASAFGSNMLLNISIFIFAVGSIICATSTNFTEMIIGRSIQGMGSGAVSSLTYIIVSHLVTLHERTKWFGMITFSWILGTVLGPIIGGACAEVGRWSIIFWINIPFCVCAVILNFAFLKTPEGSGWRSSSIRKIDWIGLVAFIAGLFPILLAITWGGVTYPWYSLPVLIPLVLGSVVMTVFIGYSVRFAKSPLFPRQIFRSRTAIVSYVGTVVHGMILASALYYETMYFMVTKRYSPWKSAIAQLSFMLSIGPVALLVGIHIGFKDRYRWALLWGWLFTISGVAHMASFDATTATWLWIVICIISGIGLGLLFSSLNYAIQAATQQSGDHALAAAFFSFLRSGGLMLGISIPGNIFQNSLRKKLESFDSMAFQAAEIARNAMAFAVSAHNLSDSSSRDDIVDSYNHGLRISWLFLTALCVVVAGTTYFVAADISLRMDFQSSSHADVEVSVGVRETRGTAAGNI